MKNGTVISNSMVLIGGRIALSAGRLLVAIIIVRLCGSEVFGAYALVLALVALFDWLVDFGQTDIAVREVMAAPGDRAPWLGALMRNKFAMGVLAVGLMPAVTIVLGYDSEIVLGSLVGALAVVLHAAIQLPRTILKLEMRQDVDVLGEVSGLIVMVPAVAWAALADASLPLLLATFALARVVHLGTVLLFAHVRRHIRQSIDPAETPQAALGARAMPLGTAGLLATVHESIAPVLLSKLYGLDAVTIFVTATRFVMPVLIVTQALNSAFFPALARSWESGVKAFSEMQQSALTVSTAVAALMFSGLFCGAEFIMGLIDPSLAESAVVLKVMALVVLARAVTTIMTPVVVISRKQNIALMFTVASLASQLALQFWLVPEYGALGAASSYLVTEPLLGATAVSLLGIIFAKVELDWSQVLKTYLAALGVSALFSASPVAPFVSMVLAPSLLFVLFILLGVIPLKMLGDIRDQVRGGLLGEGS